MADLGGSILTGIDGNPLAVIAKQLRISMHEIEQTQVCLSMLLPFISFKPMLSPVSALHQEAKAAISFQ